MSEVKTNEPVKQEGDFSLKGKATKPKQLASKQQEVVKVNIKEPLVNIPDQVTKVVIPKDELNTETNAIQTQETNDSDAVIQKSENSKDSEGVVEEVRETNEEVDSPLQLITNEEEKEIEEVTAEYKEAIRDEKVLGKPLPENIEKLVTFMEETGGTIEDYTRLNADYSNVDDKTLLKEYYKKTKPYLESDDVNLLLEDYDYDEDLDEERDIRKKKLAFKEEVAKAKSFLEETKSKYYDEIKLRPGVTQEQQKAMDFFNRYNEDAKMAEQQHKDFMSKTNKYFTEDFKGFDFTVSDKKFRYGVQDPAKVAKEQSSINNFVGKYLDKKGNVTDPQGYHKAIFMATNADKIINHFYEQGKSDATKEIIGKSKNPSTQSRPVSGFINGLKVKSVTGGSDSSKLKIRTKKFN
jgi:hypothetical protein